MSSVTDRAITECEAQQVSSEQMTAVESGVESSSITATQAIQRFESQQVQAKVVGASLLYQDTVSSAMKKVSAEELHLNERKVSEARTGKKLHLTSD